jgi:hypothetical protein
MTNRWRKQLLKATDVNFVLKSGSEIWSFSQHEPLGIFISLPLIRHEIWRLRKTKPVVDLGSALREVQYADHIQKGDILRKFQRGNWTPCQRAWCAPCFKPLEGDRFPMRLPKDEDGNLLVNEEDTERFCVVRPGDHLFCQFQCELCHFRNIQGRSPMYGMGVLDDSELMRCPRRESLDAFWIREPTTILQNQSSITDCT